MYTPIVKMISQSRLKKNPENADGRTDRRTDGHCHGIIRPFSKRAYKMLYMAWQLCCRGMCKYLLRSDFQQRNYSKAKFPSNLNCRQKIVSETGPSADVTPVVLFLFSKHTIDYYFLPIFITEMARKVVEIIAHGTILLSCVTNSIVTDDLAARTSVLMVSS